MDGPARTGRRALLLRWIGVAAATALAVACLGSAMAFAPALQGASETLVTICFLVAFLLFGTFLAVRGSTPRTASSGWAALTTVSDDDRSWRGAIPDRMLAGVVVAWLVLGVCALVGIGALAGGVPDQVRGRYVRDDHGVITVVTADEYHDAAGAQVRLFGAVTGVFLGVTALGAATRSARLAA